MNIYLQNLHTHTIYADGKNSLEEIVCIAIEKGFQSIGFSEHAYMSYSKEFSMPLEKTEVYKREIKFLKEKYSEYIKIYCGLEVDKYSEVDKNGFDYLIGSVHFLKENNELFAFDRSEEVVSNLINQVFHGDSMAYVRKYYREVADLPKYGNFDILGHFDLITKHSDKKKFFDESSKEYQNIVIETMEALEGKIPFFEVNTGAMARRYRKTPYPAPSIIKEFKRLGFGAVITSDCHDGNLLDCGFENATQLLKESGYKERYVLTEKGFEAVAL